jgi:glycine hydroxymethyltransferase
VGAELHPSPVGEADFITSTTHKTLRGPRGGLILSEEKHGPLLDKGLCPGIQGGPLMHIIAAKAVCFGEALQPEFRRYQQQVLRNAAVLAGELASAGFDLISGGTDNHLILVDLSARGLSGLDAERALGAAGLIVNKNVIPSDPRGPRVTSGLRIGTPAVTTRGMREQEMQHIAGWIRRVLDHASQDSVHREVRQEVAALCRRFPIYRYLDQKEEEKA